MLSHSHPPQLLDSVPMLHYPYRHGVGGQRCFYYLPKGGQKEMCCKFMLSLSSFFNSAFIPGGECQEENKEEEIHQLWDGETQFSDKRKPPGALAPPALLLLLYSSGTFL